MTPSFYKRLNSIIDMDFYEISNPVELTVEAETSTSTVSYEYKAIAFFKFTFHQNIEPEEYALIELNVEPVPEIRNLKVNDDDWMVPYKLKPQLERVVWRSKLYSKEKTVSENQSLVERTENQVDIVKYYSFYSLSWCAKKVPNFGVELG